MRKLPLFECAPGSGLKNKTSSVITKSELNFFAKILEPREDTTCWWSSFSPPSSFLPGPLPPPTWPSPSQTGKQGAFVYARHLRRVSIVSKCLYCLIFSRALGQSLQLKFRLGKQESPKVWIGNKLVCKEVNYCLRKRNYNRGWGIYNNTPYEIKTSLYDMREGHGVII